MSGSSSGYKFFFVLLLLGLLQYWIIFSKFPKFKSIKADDTFNVYTQLCMELSMICWDRNLMVPTNNKELHDILERYNDGWEDKYFVDNNPAFIVKDGLILDGWGSEIQYYYNVGSQTCKFKSYGPNKKNDRGKRDDIIFKGQVITRR